MSEQELKHPQKHSSLKMNNSLFDEEPNKKKIETTLGQLER